MNYTVKFSRRKTISLKINNDGELEIFAPYNTPNDRIEYFVNLKKNWILRHQNRIKSIINANLPVINKEKMYQLGEIVDFSEESYKNLIKFSKIYLYNRCFELAKQLNLVVKDVKIRKFRSRWGSCDKNKNISLNYLLIMLPKPTIDYVIMHELCHTVYMNHQKNFHNLLKSISGSEKECKKVLKYFNFILKIY